MRRVLSGDREIDRCFSCGSLWFDYGEVRELTEGRLSAEEPEREHPEPPRGEELARLRKQTVSSLCPRCGEKLEAVDFQMTGIPVLVCHECRGILAPRRSAGRISGHFRYLREHRERFDALGASLAGAARRMREAGRIGDPGSGAAIPLPVVVPLADTGPAVLEFPVVTLLLAVFSLFVYLFAGLAGVPPTLPGGLPGLPSGAGLSGVSPEALLLFPFLHAGLFPLATGLLFLLVLGDNVEDRMGWLPFLLLYLLCGAASGIAHLLWGPPGNPPALGSAGAVAGVLGAYLVFFPGVPVRMYGLGKVASVPAYLFACVWIAAAFLIGPGPFLRLLNPAPLSLAGNLAGFGCGAAGAVLWRVAMET